MAFKPLEIPGREAHAKAAVSYACRKQPSNRASRTSIVFSVSAATIKRVGPTKTIDSQPIKWEVDKQAGLIRLTWVQSSARNIRKRAKGKRWLCQIPYSGQIAAMFPPVAKSTEATLVDASSDGIVIAAAK